MKSIESRLAGDQFSHPKKTHRKPLQPKNFTVNQAGIRQKPKPIKILPIGDSDKENRPISEINPIGSLDASLAEELDAIRQKLERLRLDKEKTERVLKERDLFFEMEMKEMEKREMMVKKIEIEIEKLRRLKEFQSSSMRLPPLQSLRLRAQEREKKMKETQLQEVISAVEEKVVDISIEASSSNSPTDQ
ncbi:myelin transcription factor [Tasmannia lanceolata]|uniref:myelin transcription factor n=1 Tax=Tasmannia lanceolata TaxID=3420 RepID=UPI0040649450